MKNIYVSFEYIGNSDSTIEFIQMITEQVFGNIESRAACKRRELTWKSPHLQTIKYLIPEKYHTTYKFSQDEFELMFLPFTDRICGFYDEGYVHDLTNKIEAIVDEHRL